MNAGERNTGGEKGGNSPGWDSFMEQVAFALSPQGGV